MCPPQAAYGLEKRLGIPVNSTLVFDVLIMATPGAVPKSAAAAFGANLSSPQPGAVAPIARDRPRVVGFALPQTSPAQLFSSSETGEEEGEDEGGDEDEPEGEDGCEGEDDGEGEGDDDGEDTDSDGGSDGHGDSGLSEGAGIAGAEGGTRIGASCGASGGEGGGGALAPRVVAPSGRLVPATASFRSKGVKPGNAKPLRRGKKTTRKGVGKAKPR